MRVFARKTQGANGGKLGLCASLAALAVAVLLLALAGCKNSSGGDAPSPAPIRNPVPPAPVPESKDDDDDETLGTLTYKFFVEGIQIGSKKGVKFQGEATFAQILGKANLLAEDYDADNFEGWAVEGSGIIVDAGTVFATSTNFVATYKKESNYREAVSADDLVNCAWYSDKEKAFLVLSNTGDMISFGIFEAVKVHSEGNSIFDIMLALETAKQYFALLEDHKGSKEAEWEAMQDKIDGPDFWSLTMNVAKWEDKETTDTVYIGTGFMWGPIELVMSKSGDKLYDKADGSLAYVKVQM